MQRDLSQLDSGSRGSHLSTCPSMQVRDCGGGETDRGRETGYGRRGGRRPTGVSQLMVASHCTLAAHTMPGIPRRPDHSPVRTDYLPASHRRWFTHVNRMAGLNLCSLFYSFCIPHLSFFPSGLQTCLPITIHTPYLLFLSCAFGLQLQVGRGCSAKHLTAPPS